MQSMLDMSPRAAIKYFPDWMKGSSSEKTTSPYDTDSVSTAPAGPVTADLPTDLYSGDTYAHAHPHI